MNYIYSKHIYFFFLQVITCTCQVVLVNQAVWQHCKLTTSTRLRRALVTSGSGTTCTHQQGRPTLTWAHWGFYSKVSRWTACHHQHSETILALPYRIFQLVSLKDYSFVHSSTLYREMGYLHLVLYTTIPGALCEFLLWQNTHTYLIVLHTPRCIL